MAQGDGCFAVSAHKHGHDVGVVVRFQRCGAFNSGGSGVRASRGVAAGGGGGVWGWGRGGGEGSSSHALLQDEESVVALGEGAEYVGAVTGAQEHGYEEVGGGRDGEDVAGVGVRMERRRVVAAAAVFME